MTVDETTNSSVEVEIFDQAYNLRRTDHDHIVKLAAYVDAMMRAIGSETIRRIVAAWPCLRH